ncbi:hypothetical protein PV11_10232 [Exophiala sideris]|uniref:SnoaL-like domain-containing protein n=1 Tax=Exophiala sideris TaxID=1016849 RepID=A0A0D1YUL4_9EURO|nr:hypothetical protein PV11_10232 [Exophiala sideris]
MSGFDLPGSSARFIAKSEIETLFHRYAVLAKETASAEKMSQLFTQDAAFRLPNGVTVQPAELLQVVQGNNPKFIRHHITSIDINFVSPSRANAESYFFAVTHLSSFDHWGHWEDIVTREADGTWLISDRTIVVEGTDPKGWYKTVYPD